MLFGIRLCGMVFITFLPFLLAFSKRWQYNSFAFEKVSKLSYVMNPMPLHCYENNYTQPSTVEEFLQNRFTKTYSSSTVQKSSTRKHIYSSPLLSRHGETKAVAARQHSTSHILQEKEKQNSMIRLFLNTIIIEVKRVSFL